MEAALYRNSAAHQELAVGKEELHLEREEVNKLRQVKQKGVAGEATAPFPLTTADVVELFRLLKDSNINYMSVERDMVWTQRELVDLRKEVKSAGR